MSHMSREVQELMDRCRRVGWRVETTMRGHNKVWPPHGPVLHFGGGSGDGRAHMNIESMLVRAGLEAAEEAITRKKRPREFTSDAPSAPQRAPVPPMKLVALPHPPKPPERLVEVLRRRLRCAPRG